MSRGAEGRCEELADPGGRVRFLTVAARKGPATLSYPPREHVIDRLIDPGYRAHAGPKERRSGVDVD